MSKRISAAALLGACGALVPAQASAQSAVDIFARDNNVSVAERSRPEYDAVGINLGGFYAFPTLRLAIESTDNAYATDTDRISDIIYHADPGVRLVSDWNRHALSAWAEASLLSYADTSNQSVTDYRLGGDARIDITRDSFVFAGVSYGDLHESTADTPANIVLDEPIAYTTASAFGGAQWTGGRLRLRAEARFSTFDYDDGRELITDTPFEADDRDRDVVEATATALYALSPMTALYASASFNQRDFDLEPPESGLAISRDSNGAEFLAGIDFEIGDLVRAKLSAGYLSQDYEDAGLDNESGLAVKSQIEWFPDELLTVTLNFERKVDDSGVFETASYIDNEARARVDYELRRNIVVSAAASYEQMDYQGVDRVDDRWRAQLSINYALNRGVTVFGEVSRFEQTSSGDPVFIGRDFDVDRALIGVKLRR